MHSIPVEVRSLFESQGQGSKRGAINPAPRPSKGFGRQARGTVPYKGRKAPCCSRWDTSGVMSFDSEGPALMTAMATEPRGKSSPTSGQRPRPRLFYDSGEISLLSYSTQFCVLMCELHSMHAMGGLVPQVVREHGSGGLWIEPKPTLD